MAGSFAAQQGDGGFGEVEVFGQEIGHGAVRRGIDRRSGYFEFEFRAQDFAEFILRGARLHLQK